MDVEVWTVRVSEHSQLQLMCPPRRRAPWSKDALTENRRRHWTSPFSVRGIATVLECWADSEVRFQVKGKDFCLSY